MRVAYILPEVKRNKAHNAPERPGWPADVDLILVTIMLCTFLKTNATLLAILLLLGLAGCSNTGDDGKSTTEEIAQSAATATGTADTCALLSAADIADIVGNPVLGGEPYAGPEVCRWDTEDTDHVSVVLTVRLSGSPRAQVLCEGLNSPTDGSEPISGLGDKAEFRFSSVAGMFDSGDLDACGAEGFVSVSLNGKKDEAAMKEEAIALTRMVFSRL